MKAFVFAMFAMGTALFLAAIFWPDRAQPVAPQQKYFARNADKVARHDSQPTQPQKDVWDTPPEPARPATPATPAAPATPAMPTMRAAKTSAANLNATTRERLANTLTDLQLTSDEEDTFKQTGTDDTSLRNADFPNTFISKIHVDLSSPNHWVTLTWSGPNAKLQPTTQYHSSPGRGLGSNNCDDPAESCRTDSNCTPKGTRQVQAFSNSMTSSPACRFVTWFDTKRGVALHYYPDVPNYPASHGCVRLGMYAARVIHNNSKIGETEVVVEGTWTAR